MDGMSLLDVLRGVMLDPAEQAAYNQNPTAYLQQYGYDDVDPADLSEAFGLVADTLPPEQAQAGLSATAAPEAATFGVVTPDFDGVADNGADGAEIDLAGEDVAELDTALPGDQPAAEADSLSFGYGEDGGFGAAAGDLGPGGEPVDGVDGFDTSPAAGGVASGPGGEPDDGDALATGLGESVDADDIDDVGVDVGVAPGEADLTEAGGDPGDGIDDIGGNGFGGDLGGAIGAGGLGDELDDGLDGGEPAEGDLPNDLGDADGTEAGAPVDGDPSDLDIGLF
jgi:hypothetical protein